MGRRLQVLAFTASLAFGVSSAVGQSVISAHSGLVHYVEGQVTLDGKAVDVKYSQFPEVRVDQVLKTEEGRAEVLLTPGVFLRLAENTSFRMISNSLSDSRVEALTGTMMIEHGEVAKDNAVTVQFKDRSITFAKSGLYRLDADGGILRVYQGEARVATKDQSMVVKQARQVELAAAAMTAVKFDPKVDDDFYRWASRRASYLALANLSAAKSLRDSGYASRSGLGSGMWSFNPYFGMMTYVPFGSMWYSPFGYSFWTPSLINQAYLYGGYYPGYYGYGNGYSSGGGGSAARGRFSTATNYGIPSRPANVSAAMGGSRRSFGGGGGGADMSSGGFGAMNRGGWSNGPSYSGGGGGGGSYSAPASSGGGGGGGAVSHSGGGGGGAGSSSGGRGR